MTTTKPRSFWHIAIKNGLIAGTLIIGIMIGGFQVFGVDGSAGSMAFGFLLMFMVLSLIYFGIRGFRAQQANEMIKFSKAFLLGLATSLFAGIAYVLIWEVYTALTNNSFIGTYTDHLIELEQAKGVGKDALDAFVAEMEIRKANYAKPLYRMGITFAEMFPMGVVVSLISALILHRPKFWSKAKTVEQ